MNTGKQDKYLIDDLVYTKGTDRKKYDGKYFFNVDNICYVDNDDKNNIKCKIEKYLYNAIIIDYIYSYL